MKLKGSTTRQYNVPSFWAEFLAIWNKYYGRLREFPDKSSDFVLLYGRVYTGHNHWGRRPDLISWRLDVNLGRLPILIWHSLLVGQKDDMFIMIETSEIGYIILSYFLAILEYLKGYVMTPAIHTHTTMAKGLTFNSILYFNLHKHFLFLISHCSKCMTRTYIKVF